MKIKTKTQIGNYEVELEFEGKTEEIKKEIPEIIGLINESFGGVTPIRGAQKSSGYKRSATRKPSSQVAVKKTTEQPKYLPNLLNTQDVKDVKGYYASKAPTTHVEAFAVFALWLKTKKGMDSIGIDETWTLCKAVKHRAPQHIVQIYRDGKSKKNFFDSVGDGRYIITSIGETFVEFDLPKQKGDEDE